MSADLTGWPVIESLTVMESLTVAEVCALELANRPEVIEQLRAEHVDDGTGRCWACGRPDDYPPRPYPCSAARVVLAADRLAAST